jgi:hypothetical protein
VEVYEQLSQGAIASRPADASARLDPRCVLVDDVIPHRLARRPNQ